ncbi:MFS transporter [Micromonospora sp. M12]
MAARAGGAGRRGWAPRPSVAGWQPSHRTAAGDERPADVPVRVRGGVAVAHLYWAQPLLSFIADDLGAATATAGWLVTATQVGYAVGVLLLVPLGDVLDRRRFVPVMLLASAAALLLCAWRRRSASCSSHWVCSA